VLPFPAPGYDPGLGPTEVDRQVPNDACVTYKVRNRFVIGGKGQLASFFLLGALPPYAWNEIEYTLCCDGRYNIRYAGSDFPSHVAYKDSEIVGHHSQGDIESFIYAGWLNDAPGGTFARTSGDILP